MAGLFSIARQVAQKAGTTGRFGANRTSAQARAFTASARNATKSFFNESGTKEAVAGYAVLAASLGIVYKAAMSLEKEMPEFREGISNGTGFMDFRLDSNSEDNQKKKQ